MSGAPPGEDTAAIARRASRGSMVYVGRTVAVQAVQLVGSLVIARALLPSQYGSLAIALTLVGTVGLIYDLGIRLYLSVAPTVTEADLQSDTFVALGIALLGCVVLLPVGLVLVPDATSLPAAVLAPLLCLKLVANALRIGPLVRLERGLAFGRIGSISLVEVLALYVLQIVLLLAGWELWSVIAAQLAGATIGTVLTVRRGGGFVRPRPHDGIRGLVRKGLPYQGPILATAATGVALPIVAALLLTPDEIGWWAWSTTISTPVVMLLVSLQQVIVPSMARIYRTAPDRLAETTDVVARIVTATAAAGAGVLLGMVTPMVELLFGDPWIPAIGATRVALVGVVAVAFVQVLGADKAAQLQAGPRMRATVVSLLVGLPLAPLLAYEWGPVGMAAVAAVVIPVVDVIALRTMCDTKVAGLVLRAAVILAAAGGLSFACASLVSTIAELVAGLALVSLASLGVVALVDFPTVTRVWRLTRRA